MPRLSLLPHPRATDEPSVAIPSNTKAGSVSLDNQIEIDAMCGLLCLCFFALLVPSPGIRRERDRVREISNVGAVGTRNHPPLLEYRERGQGPPRAEWGISYFNWSIPTSSRIFFRSTMALGPCIADRPVELPHVVALLFVRCVDLSKHWRLRVVIQDADRAIDEPVPFRAAAFGALGARRI